MRPRQHGACRGWGRGIGARLSVVDGKVGEEAAGQLLGVRVQHVLVHQQQLVGLRLRLKPQPRLG